MSMFASSLSRFDDNARTLAPILVSARLLSLSNVLGNVLATVYTTNIYIFIDVSGYYNTDHTRKRSRKSYSCKRSTRGEMRKARLPQSSRQTVRQTLVSLITPKSRWYKPGYIVPTYTLFACVDSSPHTSSSPSTASQQSLYNYGTPPTVNKFCSLLSFLSELVRLNRRRLQQRMFLGSTR